MDVINWSTIGTNKNSNTAEKRRHGEDDDGNKMTGQQIRQEYNDSHGDSDSDK